MVSTKEAITSVFLTKSSKVFLHSIKPEDWFWQKVKRLVFGFLILRVSHKQRVSFISISFASGLFFNVGSPLNIYLLSKIKLKSPPKILFLLLKSFIF